MDNEGDVTNVTASDWVDDMKIKLRDFWTYWCQRHAGNPIDFPISMTRGDWDEEFESWLASEKEKRQP